MSGIYLVQFPLPLEPAKGRSFKPGDEILVCASRSVLVAGRIIECIDNSVIIQTLDGNTIRVNNREVYYRRKD